MSLTDNPQALFTDLYNQLVQHGMTDYCEALRGVVDIEVLDIDGIAEALEDVTAPDSERVFTAFSVALKTTWKRLRDSMWQIAASNIDFHVDRL